MSRTAVHVHLAAVRTAARHARASPGVALEGRRLKKRSSGAIAVVIFVVGIALTQFVLPMPFTPNRSRSAATSTTWRAAWWVDISHLVDEALRAEAVPPADRHALVPAGGSATNSRASVSSHRLPLRSSLGLSHRVGHRQRGQQLARVRIARVTQHLGGCSLLLDLALLQHDDAVSDGVDHGQIVTDKK